MTDEVNKLIYNLLAGEHAVHIPEVGSLLVERVPAKRLSKRRIVPPYYGVIFTSHNVGTSLVNAIAQTTGSDVAAAQEVFDRWRERTLQGDQLTIEGVGVLRQKGFAVDPAFDKVINPQPRTPMSVRSANNSHWVFWTFSSVAILCGIGACGWILYDRMVDERFPEPLELHSGPVATRVETPAQPDSTAFAEQAGEAANTVARSSEAGTGVAQTAAVSSAAEPQAVQPETAISLGVQTMTPGFNYVVLGVFSTEQNARRAAKQAMKTDPSLRCGVWNYGNKFMTSLFASDDTAACARFVEAHADRYPDAWSYKAR